MTNPFMPFAFFLYLLKTSENFQFSDVFRRYIKDKWREMGKGISEGVEN